MVSWWVGDGGVLRTMLGWHYSRACAWQAGVVGAVMVGLHAQQCCTSPATVRCEVKEAKKKT